MILSVLLAVLIGASMGALDAFFTYSSRGSRK